MDKGSVFFTSLATIVIPCVFENSRSKRWGDILSWFSFAFSWSLIMLRISSCTCWPSLYLFWKNVQTFCPSFNWIPFFFFCYWVVWVFIYILEISPFSDKWFAIIFYHSVGCLFILLMDSFTVKNFLVWCSPTYIFFVYFAFNVRVKKTIAMILLPMFSSRSFMVSVFLFKFLIHFELIFVYCVRQWSGIILPAWDCSVSPKHWINCIFPLVYSWLLCHKLIDCIYAWVISDLSIQFHWFTCLFLCQYEAVLITKAF